MVRTIGFNKPWERFCVVTVHVVADAAAVAVAFSRLSTTSHTNTGCCCDFADVLNDRDLPGVVVMQKTSGPTQRLP